MWDLRLYGPSVLSEPRSRKKEYAQNTSPTQANATSDPHLIPCEVMATDNLPLARVTRYATPLREGGSLPGLVDTDLGITMIGKWRGAGQGATALVAEVIVGELARVLGLPMPALYRLQLDSTIGRNERDEEIRELLVASEGLNLGMRFLEGALPFDPAAKAELEPTLATKLVLFDAYTTNVDRTARNTNLLWWSDGLWLIDHGAALYWHHGWDGLVERASRPFPLIGQHVLLPCVNRVDDALSWLRDGLTDDAIKHAVAAVPSTWLPEPVDSRRAAYVDFLSQRRDALDSLAQEVTDARASL